MMTSLYFPILFVKDLSHFDDKGGGGGKNSQKSDELICERPLRVIYRPKWPWILTLTLTSDVLETYIFIFATLKNSLYHTWFNHLGPLEAEIWYDSSYHNGLDSISLFHFCDGPYSKGVYVQTAGWPPCWFSPCGKPAGWRHIVFDWKIVLGLALTIVTCHIGDRDRLHAFIYTWSDYSSFFERPNKKLSPSTYHAANPITMIATRSHLFPNTYLEMAAA